MINNKSSIQQLLMVTPFSSEETANECLKTVLQEAETVGLHNSNFVSDVLPQLGEALKQKKAVAPIQFLTQLTPVFVPLTLPLVGQLVNLLESKDKPTMEAALKALYHIADNLHSMFLSQFVEELSSGFRNAAKPIQKSTCLDLLTHVTEKYPKQISALLVDLVPLVADCLNDIKKDIIDKAVHCLTLICSTNGNKDLAPFIPTVIEANRAASKVPACVEKLASCIFVQNVEAPALAVTTPVLVRGLNEKKTEVRRKCCVIIENMCKLVEDPRDVAPLLPRLAPLLGRTVEGMSDPEARVVAERALEILNKSGALRQNKTPLTRENIGALFTGVPEFVQTFLARIVEYFVVLKDFERAAWDECMKPVLDHYLSAAEVEAILNAVYTKMMEDMAPEEEEEDDEEGLDLYKGSFSLAYGTLTLLRDTKLTLKKHKFYGLLGPNNCGKTTLMRAIVREQIEGFPKRDELVTIFVEHELEEIDVGDGKTTIDLSGVEWVIFTVNEDYKCANKCTRPQVEEMMAQTGFGKNRAADPDKLITTYSGGWKMKMQLVAAALMNADILMLDEPTGHLDVHNIVWLEDWLANFPGSIICTSHDTRFLNKMCTHVIDFQDRKLRVTRGTKGHVLEDFVAKNPDKQSYFELSTNKMKFNFPDPGFLDGVKSKTKAILRMTNVNFGYTPDKQIVFNIALSCSMASRVAVVGDNGAGKSTAIKILNNELKADSGTVYRHPNMRIATVAQHAFHHLEHHLEKTPCDYIMWRFAGNDDKESVEFATKEISVDEETAREVPWCIDQITGDIRKARPDQKVDMAHLVTPETLMDRRKNSKAKKDEYQVKWYGKPIELSSWVSRDILIQMGYIKLVQREDEKQAAALGLQVKPLTREGVEKHLRDFGLDAETSAHTYVRSLSGGQKVKVVLGAALWQNPHLVILDEPTNYLDRDGLGALTEALKTFGGGVIVISHNAEFANAVCTEKWIMEKGRLRQEGESYVEEDKMATDANAENAKEVFDQYGNSIEVKYQVTLSDKEKKKEIKNIEKRIREHNKKKTMGEDEYWELEEKLQKLKEELEG